MSNTNNGGSAFPVQCIYIEDQHLNSQGMTLRDYFAAAAAEYVNWNINTLELSAKRCYEIADAMLSARSMEKAREA